MLECDLSGAFCHALVPIRQAGVEALAVSSRYTVMMWEEGGQSCRDEYGELGSQSTGFNDGTVLRTIVAALSVLLTR